MSVLIQGEMFPLDQINSNDWGVPTSEAANAILTGKKAVIRACTRADEHICDFFEDPFAEVGRITDVWQLNSQILAKGIITDSLAAQKILDGTWEKNWSVYAYIDSEDDNGFVHGINIRSMALVRFPAWNSATWDIVSASEAGKKGRVYSGTFKIISACNCKGEIMAEETPEEKVIRLETENKALKEDNATLKGETAESKKTLGEVQASNKKLSDEIKAKDKKIASLERTQETSLTQAEVSEMLEENDKKWASKLETAIPEAIAANEEAKAKKAALQRYEQARKACNKDYDVKKASALSSEELNDRSIDLEELAAKKAGNDDGNHYPPNNTGHSNGVNTGIWDPETRRFKDV